MSHKDNKSQGDPLPPNKKEPKPKPRTADPAAADA